MTDNDRILCQVLEQQLSLRLREGCCDVLLHLLPLFSLLLLLLPLPVLLSQLLPVPPAVLLIWLLLLPLLPDEEGR